MFLNTFNKIELKMVCFNAFEIYCSNLFERSPEMLQREGKRMRESESVCMCVRMNIYVYVLSFMKYVLPFMYDLCYYELAKCLQ